MARTNRSYANQALTGLSLANLKLTSFDFTNASLTGCDFANADITESDFTNASLTGCDFTNADITDCTGLTSDQLQTSIDTVNSRRRQVMFNSSRSFDSSAVSVGNMSFQSQSFITGTHFEQSSLNFGWLHCECDGSNGIQQVSQFGQYDGVLDSRVVDFRYEDDWLVRAESIGGLKVRVSARNAESEGTGDFWEVILELDESINLFGMTITNQIDSSSE